MLNIYKDSFNAKPKKTTLSEAILERIFSAAAIDPYFKVSNFLAKFKKRFLVDTLSEQLAHSAVDLRLKEISEFLHGSEMNKNPTLP